MLGNTNTLVKTGYTFDNWYSNTTGTGGTAYTSADTYSSAENIILYAKWNPVARTVTYNLGSGTGTIPTQLTGRFIGSTFTTVDGTGFSRSGFAFAGWSDGTTTYGAGATYLVGTLDIAFTAQWTANIYTVSYDFNGGTGSAISNSSFTVGGTAITYLWSATEFEQITHLEAGQHLQLEQL